MESIHINLTILDGWLTSILLVITGIVILFAGKFLLRMVIGLIFGLTISYFTYVLLIYLSAGALASLLLAFIVFIIGFLIGWVIFKIALSLVFGTFVSIIIITVFELPVNIVFYLILTLICIIVVYLLIEVVVSAITFIFGLIVFFTGVYMFMNNLLISSILTICLAIIAVVSKLRK